VVLPESEGGLVTLSPIYEVLRRKGYAEEGECIVVEGMPVQFLPVYNALLEEALIHASETLYGDTITRVLRPEHLTAVMLQTGRDKDRQRFSTFVREADMDMDYLHAVLDRHQLLDKFTVWTRQS
jgi:hypothetical protein